eukprot:14432746-Alexandrium_andersonii.AAC.1
MDANRSVNGETAHFLAQKDQHRWNTINVYVHPRAPAGGQRHVTEWAYAKACSLGATANVVISGDWNNEPAETPLAVSYTHLTLPTICSV